MVSRATRLGVILALLAPAALAQVTPTSGVFVVNTLTTVDQHLAQVDVDQSGNFLVVWEDWGRDGSGFGVSGRWFNQDGAGQGDEFGINAATIGWQEYPSVSAGGVGDAVVVWEDNDDNIAARRVAIMGAPTGDEIQVNSATGAWNRQPSVDMTETGSFVVVWDRDGTPQTIQARRFAAGFNPIDPEFQVNTTITGTVGYSHVAVNDSGAFIASWETNHQDAFGYGVAGRPYDASGTAVTGSDLQPVAGGGPIHELRPSGGIASDGTFLIAWDEDLGDVVVQHYGPASAPLGDNTPVNTSGAGRYGQHPDVAFDDFGNHVIVWWLYADGTIVGRARTLDGTPVGDEFMINTSTLDDGNKPKVALDSDGDFMVVWTNYLEGDWRILGRMFHVDFPTVLALSATSYTVTEDGVNVTITATRTGDAGGAVSVQYQTSDGTATVGEDYTYTSGPLNWADGDSADKTFDVPILQDGDTEGSETFTVTLSNPLGGASLGSPSTAEVTILDDDISYLQLAAATQSVDEHDGTVEVTVTRTGDLTDPVTVDYATADLSATQGDDYTGVSDQLSWDGGVGTSQVVGIDITDDSEDEGPETFTFTLFSPSAGAELGDPTQAVITIIDNDRIGVAFDAADSVVESGVEATITVVRTGSTSGSVGVNYAATGDTATAGEDFTAVADTLSWGGGDGEPKTFTVPITADAEVEGDETVNLTLSSATGGAVIDVPNAVLTIVDDECTVQFTADAFEVQESAGSAQISVSRSNGGAGAVTVGYASADGTASADLDYTAVDSSVAWADGDLIDKLFAVPILDDDLEEGAETVTLTLSGVTGICALGSPSTATLTLRDDDGREIQVNTHTASAQQQPAVDCDPEGDLVVVWASYGQDGSGWGIFGQRVDAFGVPVGDEFLVNAYTSGDQKGPDVAVDAEGDFVIAWESTGQDGSLPGVFARRFEADGTPVDGELLVNTHTQGSQRAASVAARADGAFVIAWQSWGQDGSGVGVYAQAFGTNGAPLGGEELVNQHTADDQLVPAAAAWDGGYVVAWESLDQEGLGAGVFARRLDATGAPVGDEVQVNTFTLGDQESPRVAADGDGAFTVVWHSGAQDGSGDGVRARRFDPGAAHLGGELQVNTHTARDQGHAAVAMDSAGEGLIVWDSDEQDGADLGIIARRMAADGTFAGGELLVNSYVIEKAQERPDAARSEYDGHAMVWTSDGQDGDGDGIFLKVVPPTVIFRDGFESGDLSAW